MTRARRRGRLAGVVLTCLALGCSDGLTEIVVVVYAEHDVPEALDELRVQTIGFGDPESAGADRVGAEAGGRLTDENGLPRYVALRRTAGPVGPFEVRVTGLSRGRAVTRRRAVVNFVPGERRTLEVRLLTACSEERDRECEGQLEVEECDQTGCTCGVDGDCVSAVVPRERLPLWTGDPATVDAGTPDAAVDGGAADGSDLAGEEMGPELGPMDMAEEDMGREDLGAEDMGAEDMGAEDMEPTCVPTTDCGRCVCDDGCCTLACSTDDDCEPECLPGTSCEIDGEGASNLEVFCDDADCVVHARRASNVFVECEDATCVVDCRNTANCTVECNDSSCLVDCRGASNCAIERCRPGDAERCAGNRRGCGRPCP